MEVFDNEFKITGCDKKVKAILEQNRIVCGNCHALLAKKIEAHDISKLHGESATDFMRKQEPRFTKKVEPEPYSIEIKCKHRNNGLSCNSINIIEL
jgi:hypothetical protein